MKPPSECAGHGPGELLRCEHFGPLWVAELKGDIDGEPVLAVRVGVTGIEAVSSGTTFRLGNPALVALANDNYEHLVRRMPEVLPQVQEKLRAKGVALTPDGRLVAIEEGGETRV